MRAEQNTLTCLLPFALVLSVGGLDSSLPRPCLPWPGRSLGFPLLLVEPHVKWGVCEDGRNCISRARLRSSTWRLRRARGRDRLLGGVQGGVCAGGPGRGKVSHGTTLGREWR